LGVKWCQKVRDLETGLGVNKLGVMRVGWGSREWVGGSQEWVWGSQEWVWGSQERIGDGLNQRKNGLG